MAHSSPPQSTTRIRFRSLDPETEPTHKRSCHRPEPDDFEYYESARKQLSEFNESLPTRPLTCVKYEWANLMLCEQENRNPTSRNHLGVNGIEDSCCGQEEKSVLDSKNDKRRKMEFEDCVVRNPSSVSLKDYFDMMYGENRIGGSVVDSARDEIGVFDDEGVREGGVLYNGGCCEDCEYCGHSKGSQDMEISGNDSGSRGSVHENGLEVNVDDVSVQVGGDCGFEREGTLMGLQNSVSVDGDQETVVEEELFLNHRLSVVGDQEAEAEEKEQELFRNLNDGVEVQCKAQDMEQLKDSESMQEPNVDENHSGFDAKKSLEYSTSSRPISQKIQERLSATNLDDVLGDDVLMEDSDRFKQLVQNAFLKFVKLLYEVPSLWTRLTKQGEKTTLHCIVCCRFPLSNSNT